MARLVGFILLVLGVWLGASVYSDSLGPKSEAPGAEETAGDAPQPQRESPRASSRAAPSAVTSRVRERVTNAVAEGARRHSGE